MRTGRTLWLVLLVVTALASRAAAQLPVIQDVGVIVVGPRVAPARLHFSHRAEHLSLVVDRARVAELDSLLPILDDAGQVITEDEIRAAMNDGNGRRLLYSSLGALIGMLVLYNAVPGNVDADCSIYEPCSDREQFYRDWSLGVGAIAGGLILGMAPEYGRDRYKAVEHIRAIRRGGSPTR
jgi:hypothetical protein